MTRATRASKREVIETQNIFPESWFLSSSLNPKNLGIKDQLESESESQSRRLNHAEKIRGPEAQKILGISSNTLNTIALKT